MAMLSQLTDFHGRLTEMVRELGLHKYSRQKSEIVDRAIVVRLLGFRLGF